MKIYFASDHAGFVMKTTLMEHATTLGNMAEDMGAYTLNDSDDYPDFIAPLGLQISQDAKNGDQSFGIILGGSGQGEAIVANRFAHVRAGVLNSENIELVTLLRQHNDANILSIGARFVSLKFAQLALKTFIETDFSHDARHERRIKEIDKDCL